MDCERPCDWQWDGDFGCCLECGASTLDHANEFRVRYSPSTAVEPTYRERDPKPSKQEFIPRGRMIQ